MIRINLLPRTTTVGAGPSIKNQAIVAGIFLLIGVLLIFIFPSIGVFAINKKISTLNQKIEKAKKEKEEVAKYGKRLEEIKSLNKKIEEKLKIIDNIERKRTGPVWIMDNISDAVSRFRTTDPVTQAETYKYEDNKVFLSSMDISADVLTLEGMAINNTYLVAFMNNLKSMEYLFCDPQLYFSDQTGYQGAIVRKFKITAKLNLLAPPGKTTVEMVEGPDGKKMSPCEAAKANSAAAQAKAEAAKKAPKKSAEDPKKKK